MAEKVISDSKTSDATPTRAGIVPHPPAPLVEVRLDAVSYTVNIPATTSTKDEIPSVFKTTARFFLGPALAANRLLTTGKLAAPTKRFDVLTDVSGVFRPGTLTLVFAPAGHGKSAYLKAIAGNLPKGPNLSGSVTYSGSKDGKEAQAHLPQLAQYCSQLDLHLPHLTVRQTLEFVHRNATIDPAPFYPEMKGQHEKEVDSIMSLLHLHGCSHTIIGNDLLRGVSGGEKKRVTVAEALLTNAQVLALDQISDGLDASVTCDIMKALKERARVRGLTVVVSLLQPGAETVALFDDIVLLREGQVLYHGPRESISPYLRDLGFAPPALSAGSKAVAAEAAAEAAGSGVGAIVPAASPEEEVAQPTSVARANSDADNKVVAVDDDEDNSNEADLADYLVQLLSDPTKAYEKQLAQQELNSGIEQSLASSALADKAKAAPVVVTPPLTTEALAKAWKESSLFKAQMSAPPSAPPLALTTDFQKAQFGHAYSLPWTTHLGLLIRRQFILLRKNPLYLRARIMSVIIMSIILGGLYYQRSTAEALTFFGTFLNMQMNLAFGNLLEMAQAVEGKFIAKKQIAHGNYPPAAFVLAGTIAHIPVSFLTSMIFTAILYNMAGLYSSAGNFFFAWFIVWLVDLIFRNMMATFSYIGKTLQAAQAMPMPVIALFILFAGFVVSPSQMGWLTFVFYIDPFSYGMRALALNEFLSPRYNFPAPGLAGAAGQTMGVTYLTQLGFPTSRAWQYGSIGFLIGILIIIVSCAIAAFTFIDHDKNIGSRRTPAAAAATTPAGVNENEVAADAVVAALPSGLAPSTEVAITAAATSVAAATTAVTVPSAAAGTATGDNVAVAVTVGSGVPPAAIVPVASVASLRAVSSSLSPTNAAHRSHSHIHNRGWNSSIPFEKMTVVFKDITYTVPLSKAAGGGTKTILHNISGCAKPGKLLALMGASGAGKSTLLDALSSRKTSGVMTGQILLNGFPKEEATFNRICAYVEQNDLHNPLATVKEAVELSAKLRLPASTTNEQRQAFVAEVLDLLELTPLSDRMIGLPGNAEALAPAERKRLTIAVELAGNAPLLFLDEPTTGLSSQAAAAVMRVVKKISDTGRTIIITVHQPSAELFSYFADLLLLQRGGYLAYHGALGPRPGTSMSYLVSYLETHFPGNPLPDGANVAAWMLDLLAGISSSSPTKAQQPPVPAALPPSPAASLASGASTVASGETPAALPSSSGTPVVVPETTQVVILPSPASASSSSASSSSAAPAAPVAAPAGESLAHIKIPAEAVKAPSTVVSPSATAAGVGGSSTMIPGPVLQAAFLASHNGIKMRSDLEKYGKPAQGAVKVSFPSARARSIPVQISVLLRRQWIGYTRNIGLNFGRFVALVFIQLLFGIVWFNAAENNTTVAGVQTLIGAIFMSAAMAGMLNLNTALPPSLTQRPSFYRETASRMYHPIAHTVSMLLVEIPWMVVILLCAVPISYFMIGLAGNVFFFHYLVVLTLGYAYFCLGSGLAALLPTFEAAQAFAGILLPLFFLFGGLFSPPSQMVPGAAWFSVIDPITHAFSAIIPPHFYCQGASCPQVTSITSAGNSTQTTYNYVSTKYEVYEGSIWAQEGYLSIFIIVFAGIGAVATRYLRHINR
jgi:ABC-type multidrug transport system ATPase subunit/ABC-type multidrug transport system permease subunit